MYNLITKNKRQSAILMFLVCLLLIGCGYFIGIYWGDPTLGIAIALLVSAFSMLLAYFGGSSIVLTLSGAKKIEKSDYPQLYNIVEEICIAAGISKVPDVYVIEDTAPNAFATGRDPDHSAVAVTTGLLQKMNRDELQGVIAHEISHIKNYDIRLAMILAVLVGSIVLLCDAFWRISRFGAITGRSSRRESGKNGKSQGLLILIALLLAILAPFAAKLLQLAVSRQREYLADASAAELTRYPEGLASALEKIARDPEPLEVANRGTQHLYIVNPIKKLAWGSDSIFSTHPPIEKRIERLRSIAVR